MFFEKCNFDLNLTSALGEILLKEGIIDYTIEILPESSTDPVGFTSKITSVKITGQDHEQATKVYNLIAKSLSNDQAIKEKFGFAEMFKLELHIYDKVFPAYKTLQLGNDLIPLDIYPRFYHNFDETIIMEDIRSSGFRHFEEVIMDNEHLELAIVECGRFHALSFALKEKQAEQFQEIAPRNNLYFEVYQNNFKENVYNLCRKSLSILDSNTDMEAIDRFGSYVADIDLLFESLKSCLDDRYSVIIHGDLKSSNMMFKYEDPNQPKKPTKVCFFDFQVSAAGPPVLDLITLLYTNFLENQYEALDQYLSLYHKSLSEYLEKFDCDCSKLYPFAAMKEQWKGFAGFGLIVNQIIAQMESVKKSDLLNKKKDAESTLHFEFSFLSNPKGDNEVYKAIVRPLILHLVKNNFI